MDADDVALPDRLARQIEFLEQNPELGLLGGQVEFIDDSGKTLYKHPRALDDQEIRSQLHRFCAISQPAVVMRREAFLATGGYRKLFVGAIDYDFFLRIAERCQLANLAEVVLKYRVHPGQVSCSKMRQQFLSTLNAQAFAALRKDGKPEPVVSGERITSEDLERLGVDQAAQYRFFEVTYSYWIEVELKAAQNDTLLRMVDELIDLSRSGPVSRTTLSNAMLMAARIHYRKGRPLRALVTVGRAVLIRPINPRGIFREIFIHRKFPLRKRLGL
jgi:hypothetical protein